MTTAPETVSKRFFCEATEGSANKRSTARGIHMCGEAGQERIGADESARKSCRVVDIARKHLWTTLVSTKGINGRGPIYAITKVISLHLYHWNVANLFSRLKES
jgi:hypothetical protein